MTEAEVLVVGGGPVGLTLAIDLGQRGVRCLLIDGACATRATRAIFRWTCSFTTARRSTTGSIPATRCCASVATARAIRGWRRRSGAPLDLLDVRSESARGVFGRDLVVVRPDLHVAWRGDAPPEDPERIATTATGN